MHSSAADTQFRKAVRILSQETRVSNVEDTTRMADLLPDPLLAIAVSARFRNELDLDMTAERRDELVNVATVGDLRTALDGPLPPISVSDEQHTVEKPTGNITHGKRAHAVMNDERPTSGRAGARVRAPRLVIEDGSKPPTNGIEDSEISDDDTPTPLDFALSPSDHLWEGMAHVKGIDTVGQQQHCAVDSRAVTDADLATHSPAAPHAEGVTGFWPTLDRRARSIILQGRPDAASRSVFLFPDGSGSATVYAGLPRIADRVVVYGLNSPYLKDAHRMDCTFDELAEAHASEIRRRQPKGPYDFVGYSGGGALAFRTAQMLLRKGERLGSLILIDAPVPNGRPEIPDELHDYLDSIGVWEGCGRTPRWLIPHSRAFSKVLSSYYPEPIMRGQIPHVRLLWASRSVAAGRGAACPVSLQSHGADAVQFLETKNVDTGRSGWEQLLPGSSIRCTQLEDDHFGVLKSHCAVQVAWCIAGILH
jgi:pimeloyl-ACP methyl ester carboxylesterase